MKDILPQIRVMGERAILIEFNREISENLLRKLLFYKNLLATEYFEQKVEVINAYSSLLIIYHNDIENVYSELLEVKKLLNEANIDKNIISHLFHIPVCYDPEFGPDQELISIEKNITKKEIIALHTAPVYTVYFIGFLPGFLYLGGLDPRLHISRKDTPRNEVKKGAVGIGENQTGIYPKTSPGGWQIIGNSPVEIFDKNNDPPCNIFPGDKIKFYSVSREKYQSLKTQINEGKFKIKMQRYEG